LRGRLRPSPTLPAARIAQLGRELEAVANDLGDTFRGPRHWDVASFAQDLRMRGAGDRFLTRALDAYGWTDRVALAPFIAAQQVYGEIWQAYDAQRRA
jgi:hypothetical protein